MPDRSESMPGRRQPLPVSARNVVTGNPLSGSFPSQMNRCLFGMGCFWGVERLFWAERGVHTTAVGYAGGYTPNPLYEEVCTGKTGHNEVVLVVYDPALISFDELLTLFWESHDPTQGMRQGPDRGTQYRSGIYTYTDEQLRKAQASRLLFQQSLADNGFDSITTEILPAPEFYYAEDYHQQYLHKNPGGYCSVRGTGIRCALQPDHADDKAFLSSMESRCRSVM
ncbi:MAG: peptide-methionine (S)-S-oxide reductase MsrA [Granulosicoccus sp.]